jgi:hypothetical protein
MGSIGHKHILFVAMSGLSGVLALHGAFAGPPFAGQPLERVTAAVSGGSRNNTPAGIQAPNRQAPNRRLDLSPPSEVMANNQAATGPFPAPGSHRLFAVLSTPPASQNGHILSPMENVMHNFHEQGLPVAKLFQNSDSLVHLGLNQKGKPGLWIVHKLH